MSQHDFDIANQTASNARSDINNALKALASLSSGAVAPTTTYANMFWYDTTANIIKIRNEADSAWINLFYLDQSGSQTQVFDDTKVVNTGGTQTGLIGDQATATWEAGTGTTESLVSPAKVKAAIDANTQSYTQPTTLAAVGTYAFCVSSVDLTPGATISGSSLSYSNAFGDGQGNVGVGTWRCMGGATANTAGAQRATLFLRIS